jgi:glycosyltransferase involved in cell wall biosynthesis
MHMLHIISGLNNGGAEAVLYRLTTADKENTHQVISLMDFGIYGERLTKADVPVHTLNMPRGRVTIKGALNLYRLIRSINPDVVQTWLYHADLVGGVVARIAGNRAVIWSIRASCLVGGKTSRTTLLVRWVCARTSSVIPIRIVFNSNSGVRVHEALGYDSKKISVILNGYNTNQLKPYKEARTVLRNSWGIQPNQVLLGMVGRWDPQKDHANLIAALSQLDSRKVQDWRCVLVGPDMTNANAALVALLDQRNLHDRFLLLGPSSDIPAVMNAFDLHVLSSAYGEAFPNVVAEAMACGTPCVVTDVGDAGLIVGPTGWVVPHSDSGALAGAVQEAIVEMTNTAKWENRKAVCRLRICEKFSLEQMLISYRKVWSEAVNA